MQLPDDRDTQDSPPDSKHTAEPTASSYDGNGATDGEQSEEPEGPTQAQRRTKPPPPSAFKRTLFYVAATWMFWLLIKYFTKPEKPKVIYASRYSKDFKFRPAASPIITETLTDGRIRLRGTYPTPEPQPDSAKQLVAKNARKRRRTSKRKKATGSNSKKK